MTPRHRLHIVSGKGGTGKTTVAAALACALSTPAGGFCFARWRPARHPRAIRLPHGWWTRRSAGFVVPRPAARCMPCRSTPRPRSWEYLETFYHLGLAAKASRPLRGGGLRHFHRPGLRDVLLTGKVYEAVRRGEKNLARTATTPSCSTRPTGRIAQFLNVHQAVAGLARVGPIRGQADSIMRMLRSTTTAVHLVTLLEDMPVTETEEAVAALRPTGISVETVIAGKVISTPLDEDQLQRAATGTTLLRVRALNDQQNRLLGRVRRRGRPPLQRRDRHRRLTSLGVPLAEIAFDAAGIDEAALFSIADQIRNRPLEVDGPGSPFFDVDAIIADRQTKIMICCGAGGVGKTTTSAALALGGRGWPERRGPDHRSRAGWRSPSASANWSSLRAQSLVSRPPTADISTP